MHVHYPVSLEPQLLRRRLAYVPDDAQDRLPGTQLGFAMDGALWSIGFSKGVPGSEWTERLAYDLSSAALSSSSTRLGRSAIDCLPAPASRRRDPARLRAGR